MTPPARHLQLQSEVRGVGDHPDGSALSPSGRRRRAHGLFAGREAFGIELGRLERSLQLQAYPLGRCRYEVTGGAEPHFVDLAPDAAAPCDCGDFAWRGGALVSQCKHMLRARLAEGDRSVLLATAALVGGLREYAVSLERRLRPPTIRLTRALRARVASAVGHPVPVLTFSRVPTDSTVRVLLGTTGTLLGTLVHEPDGVSFLSVASSAADERAA